MTGTRQAAVVAAAFSVVGARGAPAGADSCVRIGGGLYQSEGCGRSPGGRIGEGARRLPPGQRSEPSFERPFEPFDPQVRRLPSPFGPAREGPTTLADLQLVRDGTGGYRGSRPGFEFRIARDGRIEFRDRAALQMPAMLALGALGVFDLTDLVIRLQGGDPYTYDKGLVAGLTRPMREAMTDEDRRERLKHALVSLPGDLRVLWSRTDLDVATRRALLFRLWDEMVEGRDDPEGQAAAQARTLIYRFVGTNLSAGSPDAYTDTELAVLNAQRRSRAVFAPYGD